MSGSSWSMSSAKYEYVFARLEVPDGDEEGSQHTMSFRVAMEYLQFIFHLQLFQEPKNTLRARLFKPFIEIVNLSCTAQEDSNKIYQYKITFGFSVEAAGVDAMVCASVYTIGRYVGYVQI